MTASHVLDSGPPCSRSRQKQLCSVLVVQEQLQEVDERLEEMQRQLSQLQLDKVSGGAFVTTSSVSAAVFATSRCLWGNCAAVPPQGSCAVCCAHELRSSCCRAGPQKQQLMASLPAATRVPRLQHQMTRFCSELWR